MRKSLALLGLTSLYVVTAFPLLPAISTRPPASSTRITSASPVVPLQTQQRPRHSPTRLAARSSLMAAVFSKPMVPTHTTLAGKLWPAIQKFRIGPKKLKEIVLGIISMTTWQDLLFLGVLGFGSIPFVQAVYKYKEEMDDDDDATVTNGAGASTPVTVVDGTVVQGRTQDIPAQRRKARWMFVADTISLVSKVALSVYAVDVLLMILSTLGFQFATQSRIGTAYAKLVYTTAAVHRFLLLKRVALCRIFRVRSDDMGRIEIVNRLVNAATYFFVGLLLLDWLSIKMGKALTGLVGIGSVGTLALTLASQDLVSQLLSGVALTLTDKVYVGDSVVFGDGTAGKVVHMGFLETRLRGSDNVEVRVPNSFLGRQKVSNLSRLKRSQVKVKLCIDFEHADKIPELLPTIKEEIKAACPRLVTDGSAVFRVFWTDVEEDKLEVSIDTHHAIAPLGDAYWINRQNVLLAVYRALKACDVPLAPRYRVIGEQFA